MSKFNFKVGDKVRYRDSDRVGIITERRLFGDVPAYAILYPEGLYKWCSETGYSYAFYRQGNLFEE